MVARELTKVHETPLPRHARGARRRATAEANLARGEITVVVHGAAPREPGSPDSAELRRVVDILARELPPGRAAALAAALTGAPRAAAYALATRKPTGTADDGA